MKLLRVIRRTDLESGGPIEGLIRSSEELIRRGHQVEVVSLESADEAISRKYSFPVIGVGRGFGRYGYNPRLAPWIKANASRFDAVILHGLWNYSSFGAWRGLKDQSVPFFVFVHGMMDPWFKAHYPLKSLGKDAYWQLAEGRVLRSAKAVLFTSEEERQRARGVFGGSRYIERVVRYGIPSPPAEIEIQKRAFFEAFPKLKDRPFLLFLGRLHPKKGCDLLIRSFAKVANEIPPGVQLAFAGPGLPGYVAELKKIAHGLHISDRLEWLGMLDGDRKWGALRSAEAFILPSHQENFAIAVAEATACAVPVLISDKVNTWREVDASHAGLIDSDTDLGSYSLIRRFYQMSPEERTRMGSDARQCFLRNFEIEAAVDDLSQAIGFAPTPTLKRPRPKKILQILHSITPESGGPIEAVNRISEALMKEGHEVKIACLDLEKDAAANSLSPFPTAYFGAGSGKYGFSPRFTKWIRENAEGFDVAILHGLWNYSSFGAWLALRKRPTPYFVYAHGMMDRYFSHRYPLKHLLKQVYWWLAEGRVLRDAAEVFFTCDEEAIQSRRVFHGFSYKERIVRFGTTDPRGNAETEKRIFRSSVPSLGDRPFLLFLGRIHPKKGCDLLIEAFANSLNFIPPDIDLVLAGPDQIGWTPELKRLANHLGVGNRIHWLGMLKGEHKWGAFRSAEATILPSHQENFGIVVAESMACSTPVLISNKVNIWREVLDSTSGLVEPDSIDGIIRLIRRFFELSHHQRSKMRKSARQEFEAYFSMEATAAEILRALKSHV